MISDEDEDEDEDEDDSRNNARQILYLHNTQWSSGELEGPL
jgi:hypothetical protein